MAAYFSAQGRWQSAEFLPVSIDETVRQTAERLATLDNPQSCKVLASGFSASTALLACSATERDFIAELSRKFLPADNALAGYRSENFLLR
ncbi:MAG: hypothetical protein JO001_05975 [Alphaproteobacteria bacterium]|nr:hypothetical protein [Alphaproteobacteria bacterium]